MSRVILDAWSGILMLLYIQNVRLDRTFSIPLTSFCHQRALRKNLQWSNKLLFVLRTGLSCFHEPWSGKPYLFDECLSEEQTQWSDLWVNICESMMFVILDLDDVVIWGERTLRFEGYLGIWGSLEHQAGLDFNIHFLHLDHQYYCGRKYSWNMVPESIV